MHRRGKVVSINISREKGVPKSAVGRALMVEDLGIEGDAHAGDWHRQVSLLAAESIEKMRAAGLDVSAGDFAENITTENIDLSSLKVGDRLKIGECELEITQIGKECHCRCAIFYQAGDCVMPREGVFARVLSGGWISVGDEIGKSDAGS